MEEPKNYPQINLGGNWKIFRHETVAVADQSCRVSASISSSGAQ